MSSDQDRQKGAPSRTPNDPQNNPGKNHDESNAQSQSKSIADEERANREDAGSSRRNGSQSNGS